MTPKLSWRYNLVATGFLVVGFAIFFQLIRLQVFDVRKDILLEGESYRGQWQLLSPARGQIFDQTGKLLAGNREVYEIGVDLSQVKDKQGVIYALTTYLDVDRVRIAGQLEKAPTERYEYIVIQHYVERAQAWELIELGRNLRTQAVEGTLAPNAPVRNLAGVVFTPKMQRTYPELELASNVLGFVSWEGRGYFGVEQRYNDLLSGKEQWVWVPSDPYLAAQQPELPSGISIILTLDREIQAEMEKILDASIARNGSESGTIVVLRPKTGEILAMATTPRFDLNRFGDYPEMLSGEKPFNRAVSEIYEPGSVFKVITMASALNEGSVNLETEFLDTGYISYGGIPIYNWNRGAWGPQTMLGCMQYSLNVCLTWVAIQLGSENFYDYLDKFGFGHTTDVDLAGEVAGIMRIPGQGGWHDSDLATNSFGQGLSVTPLQIAVGTSALANDGKIMTPRILAGIITEGTQRNISSQVSTTPITAETAHNISEMLANSLELEASVALVPGYRVSGKTGTAQIPSQFGYVSNLTNVSFVGWGPTRGPEFLVYIWFEKPTTSIWGSEVAAPVFREIVERLVVLMDIPPDSVHANLSGH